MKCKSSVERIVEYPVTYKASDIMDGELRKRFVTLQKKAAMMGIEWCDVLIDNGLVDDLIRRAAIERNDIITECIREILCEVCKLELVSYEASEMSWLDNIRNISGSQLGTRYIFRTVASIDSPTAKFVVRNKRGDTYTIDGYEGTIANMSATYYVQDNSIELKFEIPTVLAIQYTIAICAAFETQAKSVDCVADKYREIRKEWASLCNDDMMEWSDISDGDISGTTSEDIIKAGIQVYNKLSCITSKQLKKKSYKKL